MKLRFIMRRDPVQKIIRIFRLIWERGTVGDGKGYSAQFTLALSRKLFLFHREYSGWFLIVAGLRFHYARSYGGHYA